MINITVCIGSSCHIKGARQVVEQLQHLIAVNDLNDQVELGGTGCIGSCLGGVCVKVGTDCFSVTTDNVEEFFKENVINKLNIKK